MLYSDYKPLCPVALPYAERQLRYGKLDAAKLRMPKGYRDYHSIVDDLLRAAGITSGVVYLTVDEKVIPAGQSQRRPGPHVDGCFQQKAWIQPPIWNHYCNHLPVARMPVIVAASVPGCIAWRGLFDTSPTEIGDLSHIADQLSGGEMLPADRGYLLSPDCVHERPYPSIPSLSLLLRSATKGLHPELAPAIRALRPTRCRTGATSLKL
jgi:hypothetical protein